MAIISGLLKVSWWSSKNHKENL